MTIAKTTAGTSPQARLQTPTSLYSVKVSEAQPSALSLPSPPAASLALGRSSEHSTITVDGPIKTNSKADRPKPSSRRRQVQFRPTAFVRKIPHIDDFDEDMIESIWYTPDEMSQIKNSAKDIVERVKLFGVVGLRKDETLRGLECRLPANVKRRLLVKNDAWDAVLNEQERQWDAFEQDQEVLAKAYEPIARRAQHAAFQVGRSDSREAQRAA